MPEPGGLGHARLNGWYDITGYEADDECDGSPAPFFGTGGCGYQPEWSNALNACTASTPNPNHEGYHEAANCRGISGWAWDQTQPNAPINVDIVRDSSLDANVPANGFRSDLLSAGKGNGYHLPDHVELQQLLRRREIRHVTGRSRRGHPLGFQSRPVSWYGRESEGGKTWWSTKSRTARCI